MRIVFRKQEAMPPKNKPNWNRATIELKPRNAEAETELKLNQQHSIKLRVVGPHFSSSQEEGWKLVVDVFGGGSWQLEISKPLALELLRELGTDNREKTFFEKIIQSVENSPVLSNILHEALS